LGKRCFIVGAGDYSNNFTPGQGDFVIVADAGYTELVTRGIVPDLVVGDFDSLGRAPDHPNVLHSPAEKDDTDMMLAIKEALRRGFKKFIIDGGLGGRMDHTMANMQALVHIASSGAQGALLGRDMNVTAVVNGSVGFLPGASGIVSVFSAGSKADGVTLKGLKYPLDNAQLSCDYPIGASNEFTGSQATISVSAGALIIMWDGSPEILSWI